MPLPKRFPRLGKVRNRIAAGLLGLGMLLASCESRGADRLALQKRVGGEVTVTAIATGRERTGASSPSAGKQASSMYAAMRRFLEDGDARTGREDCRSELGEAAAVLGFLSDAKVIPPEFAERALIARACDEAILSQENLAESRILIKAGDLLRAEPGRGGRPFRIELRSPGDSRATGTVLCGRGGFSPVSEKTPGVGEPGEPGVLGVVASAPSAFLALIISHAVYLSPATQWRRILETTRPEGLAIITGDSTILLSASWYETFAIKDESWTVLRF